MKTLSVLVPVYNTEKYLERCLDSFARKDILGDIEILVVNDGSTDGSSAVIKRYAEKYPGTVIFIDKENGGHGSTINVGIERASGKYFRVLDSDDWLDIASLGALIDILKMETSDIVLNDYNEEWASTGDSVLVTLYGNMKPGVQYRFEDLCEGPGAFEKLGPILATGNFRTEMLRSADFRLLEKCLYVDMQFDMYSIVKAETAVYYPMSVYRYFVGQSNQSISKKSYIRNQEQLKTVIFQILNYLETGDISSSKRHYVLHKIAAPMMETYYIIVTEFKRDRKKFLSFDREIKQKYPDAYSMFISRYVTFTRKTKALFLPCGPVLIHLFRKV